MIGTIRAAIMAAAAATAACACATPSVAFSIDLTPIPSASPTVAVNVTSLTSSTPVEARPQLLVLNPPGPLAAAPAQPLIQTLSQLVDTHSGTDAPDADQECVATAVYFEARSEPIEGQLAVAEVVLNRAASGKYPSSVCAVVKQASQFSFVRKGKMPPVAKATPAWRKAVAIAHIAWARLAQQIGSDVLWYHASYVSPGWGRKLTRVAQIGAHIFYSYSGVLKARAAGL
jgi:hypothetical protein